MEEMVEVISSVGFPIGMCLLLWYNQTTSTAKLTEAVDALKSMVETLINK